MRKRSFGIAAGVVAALVLCVPAMAQPAIRATTQEGRAVLLSPDGTWRYEDPGKGPGSQASPGKAAFAKGPRATARLEVLKGKCSVSYDPQKWRETKSDEVNRFEFAHSDGDGYAIVITERLQMPLDSLREVALSNAQDAAPDAKITFEERRVVNGAEVLCLKMEGSISGIAFVYYGYYFSGKAGIVQVLTFTGANLFEEYEADFLEFLNGFEAR